MKKLFLPILTLLFVGFAFAHQPRLVFKQPIGQIVNVQKPEVSQAFYGILSGQEDVYQIVSDTGFLFYVNIVVPALSGQRTDFAIDISEPDGIVTRLEGASSTWTNFFEPFGGDTYLMGPSYEKQVGAGTYTIKISNPDNQGKYSLAIGKLESFPLNETINTYRVMPELKMVFFEKPRYMTYRSLVGAFLGGLIIVLVLVVWWGIKLVKYIRHK